METFLFPRVTSDIVVSFYSKRLFSFLKKKFFSTFFGNEGSREEEER
jgi:hypothetical protein